MFELVNMSFWCIMSEKFYKRMEFIGWFFVVLLVIFFVVIYCCYLCIIVEFFIIGRKRVNGI